MKVESKSIKWTLTAVAAAAVLAAVSCKGMKEEGMDIGSTVLIYIAADNNLAPNARQNIEDIISSGAVPEYFDDGEGDVLLVYADISGEVPVLMRLSRDRYGEILKETVKEYDADQNSMSDSVMHQVLSYAAALFPSEHNGLVLWSHGTGWLPEGFYSNPVTGSGGTAVPMNMAEDPFAACVKSFGADGKEEMDIKDLVRALPVHYSYILFDACLMGGVEVAYELRGSCDYFLGSAAEILAAGMPYMKVTECLMDGRRPALEDLCRLYYEHYADKGATIALVDTRALDNLASACRDVFESGAGMIPFLDMDDIQRYFRGDRHWFYDLDDLISRLAVPEQYVVFTSALDAAVLYKKSTPVFTVSTGWSSDSFPIKTFSGLSTYVPNPENSYLDEYYCTLSWNKAVRMVR